MSSSGCVAAPGGHPPETGPQKNRTFGLVVTLVVLPCLADLALLLLWRMDGVYRDILPGGTGTLFQIGTLPREGFLP